MADLRLVTVQPPFNGMNSVAAPGKCPDGQGPLVRNFLVHIPGKLPMRGPLTREPYKHIDTNSIITAPNILTGAWSFNSKILLGFAAKSATAVQPPWITPYFVPTNESELSNSTTKAVYIDIVSGTKEEVTLSSKSCAPTGKGARIGKWVYGIGYGFSESLSVNKGKQAIRPFIRWSGFGESPVAYENAPFSCQAIKSYLNRIWTLGGGVKTSEEWIQSLEGSTTNTSEIISSPTPWAGKSEHAQWEVGQEIKGEGIPAGTTIIGYGLNPKGERQIYISKAATATKASVKFETKTLATLELEPSTLRFTDQEGPTSDLIDFWKDDVSGLENKIVVGDDDQNDFGVALAVVNQTLIIFKRHSIWALYGYSPSTFQVRNLTTERGCIDPFSVLEDDGGVYFMSQHGFEYFDGNQFTLVDEAIANITRPIAEYHAGEKGIHSATVDYGRIKVAYAGNDYIFLSIAGQGPNTGSLTGTSWAGYMHTKTGNWSEFTTSSWSSQEVPLYVDTTSGIPWAWDGRQVNPMPFLTNPWGADVAGFSQVDVNSSSTKSAIPAKFWSDRVPLSSPGYTTQFHRFLFDYRFPNGSSDGSASNGWYVTLFKSKSDELAISETQVPGQAQLADTTYLSGRRWEKDVFDEAIDCRLQVEWKSSTLDVKLAEVYDSTIELQIARQRRST